MDSKTTLTLQPVFEQLVQAASRQVGLEDAYNKYIQTVMSEPVWSHNSKRRSRLPWRLAADAKKGDRAWTTSLNQPGLYLFGSSAGVPLYWGMTEKQTLWKRVNGRYASLGSKSSMLPIASKYETALSSAGFDGFPADFVEEFVPRQRYRKFLELAADFAPHGIDGLWFTVIPLSADDEVASLEALVIRAGKKWNQSQGLPPLLNTRHA